MTTGIYARHAPYLDCHVQVGMASQQVVSVSFPADPDADAGTDLDLLDRIEGYLEGVETDFRDVDVAFTLGGDRRAVLEAVREVPYGEQVDVETLVSTTPGLDPADEATHDLARDALAANPAPLLVPDHRVRDGASAAPAEVEQKLRSLEGL